MSLGEKRCNSHFESRGNQNFTLSEDKESENEQWGFKQRRLWQLMRPGCWGLITAQRLQLKLGNGEWPNQKPGHGDQLVCLVYHDYMRDLSTLVDMRHPTGHWYSGLETRSQGLRMWNWESKLCHDFKRKSLWRQQKNRVQKHRK